MKEVVQSIEATCIGLGFMTGALGCAWCEKTGNIDIFYVALGLMLMALVCERIKEKVWKTKE